MQSDQIGMARRWRHCIAWRAVLVFLLAPGLWRLACLGLDLELGELGYYLSGVLLGLATGLVFWVPSPWRLRERLLRLIQPG